MRKRALITGINGQDGSYLAEFLIKKGYEVHGIVRQEAFEVGGSRLENIDSIKEDIIIHKGSVNNSSFVFQIIENVQPNECYHLATPSFVNLGWQDVNSLLTNTFSSTHYLLEALKEKAPNCRFYFAGSSEMFGQAESEPQNEHTPFMPRSVYGISKLASYHLVNNYSDQFGLFALTGILYNHESPRRGYQFVTRKISRQVAKIHLGIEEKIELGNIDAQRDWGFAPEYVEAMWLMLQNSEPKDYVIATGKLHKVKDILDLAFRVVNKDYKKYLVISDEYYREEPTHNLVGDASKARTYLGWEPKKQISKIIEEMVISDIESMKKQYL